MWMDARFSRVGAGVRGAGVPPWPSPCFCSHSSSRPCTVGMTPKLWTGGGEAMVHSSVRPSQGSGLATAPARIVFHTLAMKTRNDTAIRKAPTVDTRFQKFHPRSGA